MTHAGAISVLEGQLRCSSHLKMQRQWMFFSARFLPFICMQHLFPLTSKETWKVIWWIRRGYLGGNENNSTRLSVTSSSLSVTSTKLLWYRIFEMPGREKQRGFCVVLSFPPWGFGFLLVGLTRSHPTAAHPQRRALAWRGLTLQELQFGLYRNPCTLPEKQKGILSSFLVGNKEWA